MLFTMPNISKKIILMQIKNVNTFNFSNGGMKSLALMPSGQS